MGPKVQAAINFVEETGNRSAIGALSEIEKIVAGEAGTIVEADYSGTKARTESGV
jgi:carbamate kinase